MIYCVTIMKVVLFFQATTRKSWLQKLSGVHRFAQEHDWFVQVVERFATGADIRHALKAWNPVGCLVDRAMTSSAAPDIVFRGIPTVYLDQNPAKPSVEHPCLLHDSAASAGLAIKELVSRNCRSYAYLGTEKNIHWDRARQMRFETDMAAAGRPFVILHRKTLPKTMKELPKPCGILGANDYCAMEAYHAALVAGLKIPDDVLVAGIDNDESYCETVSPGLTSVEPDFEGAGYRLATMLAEEMENGELGTRNGGKVEYYGSLRIVRRGSTNAMPEVSALVRQALEYIRRHACEHGLSIASVAAEMHCSRSLATSRFRKETGRSILDEIHEHRFKRMCELLAQGNLPIAMVVERCGYESDAFAKKFFQRRTGMTMREYRKTNAK